MAIRGQCHGGENHEGRHNPLPSLFSAIQQFLQDVEALKEQMQQARGSHLPFETANHANAGAASRPQELADLNLRFGNAGDSLP